MEFDGTLVLEKLAELGFLDEFWQAIDTDNFDLAKEIMVTANLDANTIKTVLQNMAEADGEI